MRYIVLVLLVLSGSAFGQNTDHGYVSGVIKSISVKETGYIFIRFQSGNTHEFCTVDHSITIAANNPNKKEMLSLSMAAFMAGFPMGYYVTNCHAAYNNEYAVAITADLSK